MTADEINRRFTYHAPPDHLTVSKYQELRDAHKKLAILIDTLCPESREKALAITNLEQSMMWANASIARNT